MLWGRSGGKCAICRQALTFVNEVGLSSLVGQEAHIVSRRLSGPRGGNSLPLDKRDMYSNLILLCPTHHTTIDDIPIGPIDFPVEKLSNIKAEHEKWIASLDSFDSVEQFAQEQWAAIIDSLDKLMSWDSWTNDMSQMFSVEQAMPESAFVRLREASMWSFARIWPPGHQYLRDH